MDRKLTELFTIFQDKERNVVHVKDLPTILRALGLAPTQTEARKATQAMVGEESADAVHLGAFLTGAKKLVLDRRYPGCSKGELVGALQVLAKEGRRHLQEVQRHQETEEGGVAPSYGDPASKPLPPGALSRSLLVTLMGLHGEPLSAEECEELAASAPRQEGLDGAVDIDKYAALLVPTAPFL